MFKCRIIRKTGRNKLSDKEKSYFPLPFNKNNILFFYFPYFLNILWIFFSLISIFFIGMKNINNGFVIFSIIVRIVIAFVTFLFFKKIFIERNNYKKFYNYYKSYVGYGIVLTYVFYSLPRMVGEFNINISFASSISNFIFVLFITLFPAILYLFLISDKTRLVLGIFEQKEIEFEKKMKKDKTLRKKEHNRIKSERTFIENLWYEWIDVIIQAIIIALIIQQFLFQMYQIPSESMVPTFLIKDRVVVNKAIYGPHIPLTEWKIPSPIKPKIGDIVVFINPKADDPESEIRYNNVFTRIFHPFIYMMTLSLVDIDKKSDGTPKERFIVKRLIAKEGEKICLLNDKVYKKTKNTDWKLMGDLTNQKEYGQTDLYYDDNPKMRLQRMSRQLRNILDESEVLVENSSVDDLEKNLVEIKNNFIYNLRSTNLENLNNYLYSLFNEKKYIDIDDSIKTNLEKIEIEIFTLNANNFSLNNSNQIDVILKEYENLIKRYHYSIVYNSINDLYEKLLFSNNDIKYLNSQITTNIDCLEDMNPYEKYMKKFNALYKIYQLKLFNYIIENYKRNTLSNIFNDENNIFKSNQFEDIHNFYLLSVYIDSYQRIGYFRDLFSLRNFDEYPAEKDNYIKKNEYFMMGDNRYNSLDSRLGNISNEISLDKDDKTIFGKAVYVSWEPHTIKMKHVLGKAEAIYWPLERLKRLK